MVAQLPEKRSIERKDFSSRYEESTQETLIGLYSKRDSDGNPIEYINDIIYRVSITMAIAELRYILSPEELVLYTIKDAINHPAVVEMAEKFADAIGNQVFWMNTPGNINAEPEQALWVLQYEAHGKLAGMMEDEIWLATDQTSFGDAVYFAENDEDGNCVTHRKKMADLARRLRGKHCLAACGVTSVEDTLESIQEAARAEAMAAKCSMGMGINTSPLRPWSSVIANGAAASGPDRFYEKTIAKAVEAVAQGGRRGGALIELRDSNHPDLLFFIDKKRLPEPPSFASVLNEMPKLPACSDSLMFAAEKEFVRRSNEYHDKQNYLKNTNVSVLAMPGFMEAVRDKEFYPAEFAGGQWDGPIYDPRRPLSGVNKLTKEPLYGEYVVSLDKYPEAALASRHLPRSTSESNCVKIKGYFYAPDVFDRIVEGMATSGEPGIIFYDLVNAGNANDHQFALHTCNPCFHGDTFVLTKQGHFKIKDLVGRTVDVWSGKKWTEVDNFRVTGKNQKLIEITMDSGWSVKVTPKHRFELENGRVVFAKNLLPGNRLKQSGPVGNGKHRERGAYLKGFLVGDGEAQDKGARPALWLYETKYCCMERLTSSALELAVITRTSGLADPGFIAFDHDRKVAAMPAVDQTHKRKFMQGLSARKEHLLSWVKEFKEHLPMTEMLNWSIKSKGDFLAGLFDADGTAQDSKKNGFRYQLASISRSLLSDVQLLLASIGVHSTLSLCKKACLKDFKEKGGICETQDLWRITVNQPNSIRLASRCRFERLVSFANKVIKNKVRDGWSRVRSVVELPDEADKVYCCTVEGERFSLSYGISTLNCSEQNLPAGLTKDGKYKLAGVCNLSSMNAAHEYFTGKDSRERFKKFVALQQRAMDNVVDISWFILPEQNWTARKERRTGGGFAGVAQFLSDRQLEFGSLEANYVVSSLYRKYLADCFEASEDLAKERGVYPFWEGSKFEAKGQRVRNACCATNAPTGTLAQALQTTWGVDPHNGIVFSRKVRSRYVDFVAPGFQKAMEQAGAWPETVQAQEDLKGEIRANHKSCRGLSKVPLLVAKAFPVRVEVTPEQYIRHLAACYEGATADYPEMMSGISNTCSIPLHSDKKHVAEAVMLAWQLGVKAISVYPDGSRLSQPVEQIAKEGYEKADLLSVLKSLDLISSPPVEKSVYDDMDITVTEGKTYKVKIGTPEGTGTLHVTFNELKDRAGVLEVYSRTGKSGCNEGGMLEAIGRLASAFLQAAAQHGETERKRAEDIIIKQLSGISSGYVAFHAFPGQNKPQLISSSCDALAKAFTYHRSSIQCESSFGETPSVESLCKEADAALVEIMQTRINESVCTKCGGFDTTKTDGCTVCLSCGYSRCG